MTSIVAHDCKQHTEPTPISHADAMRLAGTLIARQLRHEAQTAADSEDFGRGVAHAARVVEGIVAAMGRAL